MRGRSGPDEGRLRERARHALTVALFPARVAGDSMEPTLRSGDLLAFRIVRRGEDLTGRIVCVRTPEREIVKRVVRTQADGSVWLEGDNEQASTDSRTLGSFPVEQVAGVALFVYRPLRRARLVRRRRY